MAAVLAVGLIVGAAAASLAPLTHIPALPAGASAEESHGVRSYSLEIVDQDIEMAPGIVWHAWTYNGTIPGPPITVTAGDTLRVTVTNHGDVIHSFHTHLANYDLKYDGSQLNTITGIGAGAMIKPGDAYTYEFHPTQPGIYYYHCHSADGGHTIMDHMANGLYGAIIVKAPDEPPIRDEVIFMAETGFNVSAAPNATVPYYIMNGKGLPGGEHALEQVFAVQGLPGVAAQLGKTVPLLTAKTEEPVRLNVINIGGQPHTFHLHGLNLVSLDRYPGRVEPGNNVGLLPGDAERVVITPQETGLWLFHCHVVSHADLGMIGVLKVDPAAA